MRVMTPAPPHPPPARSLVCGVATLHLASLSPPDVSGVPHIRWWLQLSLVGTSPVFAAGRAGWSRWAPLVSVASAPTGWVHAPSPMRRRLASPTPSRMTSDIGVGAARSLCSGMPSAPLGCYAATGDGLHTHPYGAFWESLRRSFSSLPASRGLTLPPLGRQAPLASSAACTSPPSARHWCGGEMHVPIGSAACTSPPSARHWCGGMIHSVGGVR